MKETDGIYSILSNMDVKKVMKNLGNKRKKEDELLTILRTAIEEWTQKNLDQ